KRRIQSLVRKTHGPEVLKNRGVWRAVRAEFSWNAAAGVRRQRRWRGNQIENRLRREQTRYRRCRSGESLRQRYRRPRRAAAFFSRLHWHRKIRVAHFLGIAEWIQQGLSRGQLRADRWRDSADAGNVSPRRIRAGGWHGRRWRSRQGQRW